MGATCAGSLYDRVYEAGRTAVYGAITGGTVGTAFATFALKFQIESCQEGGMRPETCTVLLPMTIVGAAMAPVLGAALGATAAVFSRCVYHTLSSVNT